MSRKNVKQSKFLSRNRIFDFNFYVRKRSTTNAYRSVFGALLALGAAALLAASHHLAAMLGEHADHHGGYQRDLPQDRERCHLDCCVSV